MNRVGEIRTERQYGVTAEPKPDAVRNLYALRTSDTWGDVLDILEQVCIEVETVLINTPSEKEAEVLANHKMSKAAWMIFTHMQVKVDECMTKYLSQMSAPLTPTLTAEEMERENILNPTNYPPPSGEEDYA